MSNDRRLPLGVAIGGIVLTILSILWLGYQQNRAHQDTQAVIATLIQDSTAYRTALQHQGVNPNTVVPAPPSQRAEQAEGGSRGDQGLPGLPGQPGRNGANGKDGTSPPCLSTPSQCQGSNGVDGTNGANGKDGKDGKDGSPGASVSGAQVQQDGDTCVLTLTLSNGDSVSTNSWQCRSAAVPPPGTDGSALIGFSGLLAFRRGKVDPFRAGRLPS